MWFKCIQVLGKALHVPRYSGSACLLKDGGLKRKTPVEQVEDKGPRKGTRKSNQRSKRKMNAKNKL